MRIKLLHTILFCTMFFGLSAQFDIQISMKPDSIRVGEITELRWKLNIPAKSKILYLPSVPDSFPSGIELIERMEIDSVSKSNKLFYSQKYNVSVYDSGLFAIPVLNAAYIDAKSLDTVFMESDSMFLYATTVSVDTTAAIMDIKDIYDVEYKKDFPWWILFVSLGVLALVILVYFLIRRKKKTQIEEKEEIIIDPVEEALNKLNIIREKRSWTTMNPKAYYTDITSILRRYLERQFDIQAYEMLRSEILESIKKKGFSQEAYSEISSVLRISNYVKFAKYKPSPGEFEQSLSQAIEFVKITSPKPEEQNGGKDDV